MDGVSLTLIQFGIFLAIIFCIAVIIFWLWEWFHKLPKCRERLLEKAKLNYHVVTGVLADKYVDPSLGTIRIYEYKWQGDVYECSVFSQTEVLPNNLKLYFWTNPEMATLPEYIGDGELKISQIFIWLMEFVILIYSIASLFGFVG